MTVSLSFHGIEPAVQMRLREVFNAHARRLRSRLETAAPDLVRLEGRIEKDSARESLSVLLRLKLPGRLLAASGEGTDLKAVLSAFDELERRLDGRLVRRSLAAAHSAASRRSAARELPRAW